MSTDQTHDEYVEAVEKLAANLKDITGLTWEYEMTGGGCDALVTTDTLGRYIMLTDTNAQIPLEPETEMCVGLYTDAEECEYLDSENAYSTEHVGRIISAWRKAGIGSAYVCDIHCDESRMNKHGQCDECLDDAHEMEIMARG
ncbi:hypothetical protein UFOVP1566_32 [uncultured Caudovirales phage]|uniref:Uncharacterized protein n=1 Tax=uncultured Caudovirales phage TaxID=2100421 RepID=A0A6J7XF98_9CAUD|nr:hypothetical protein UFOVP1389_2 [uncultured Caudovirales phage]CAB5229954.1 hypothetical protein UFOVP1566_32 [uncultured Caudovirales phage]